jgi:hypothetical protein
MVAALEAAKVGNARQLSSYERHKHRCPGRSRITAYRMSLCAFATLQEGAGHIDQGDRQRRPGRTLDFPRA